MKQHQKKSGKSNASFGQHHIIQELSKLQIIVISIYYLEDHCGLLSKLQNVGFF
jgi:hypothetical protein